MNKKTKISFVGDIMCQPALIEAYKDKKYNFDELFDNMKEEFQKSDLVIGNLETPISIDNSNLAEKRFVFNAPFSFAKAVKNAGIEFVSTANNHCLDAKLKGLISTIDSLEALKIQHTGTFKTNNTEPSFLEVNGIKFGIVSYTYGTNAFENKNYINKNDLYHINLFQSQELSNKLFRYLYYNKSIFGKIFRRLDRRLNGYNNVWERNESHFSQMKKLKKDISILNRSNCDYKIMLAHFGGQWNNGPLKKTKNQINKLLSNNNFDIVIGNHEHYVHPAFYRNDKIGTFCLGNFDCLNNICYEPFDVRCDYSIMFNIYFNDRTIDKATFNVLVRENLGNNRITVKPAYKYYNELKDEHEKTKVKDEILKIVKTFSNKDYLEILEEYQLDKE